MRRTGVPDFVDHVAGRTGAAVEASKVARADLDPARRWSSQTLGREERRTDLSVAVATCAADGAGSADFSTAWLLDKAARDEKFVPRTQSACRLPGE
jgi:hypothetical protein